MSLSPQKMRIALEAQIDRRIDAESPTKYDVNFYVRKINRLENDFSAIQDELSSARIRLRKAQDFEIKYDLVLKQNNNLLAENDRLAKDLQLLRVDTQRHRLKLEQEQSRKQDLTKERTDLTVQIDNLSKKLAESEERRLVETSEEAGKMESVSKRDLDSFRKDATERIQRYENEIRRLQRIVEEKETVEKVVGMKVDRIRKQKDEEIQRQKAMIDRQKADAEVLVSNKNDQVEQLQAKFEKMFEYELENIKLNIENQDEIFSIEVNGLKQMLTIKNDEIGKLLYSLKSQSEQYDRQRQGLKDEIVQLRDKIYKIERENELELYNVKERLTKIQSLDIQALDAKYKQLIQSMKQDKGELERLIKAKDQQLQLELKQLQRLKNEMHDKIKERDLKIRQLMERLKDTGAINANQMKVLHMSFHKIQSQKQAMSTGYQQNIGFLDQQLKKMTASLELRNAEIRTLQDELAFVKRVAIEDQRELDAKWKAERRDRDADRDRDRAEKERIDDDWRNKEKEWRIKERQLQREKQKQEREKKRLTFVMEEFQKDNSRLNNYIKQLDEALKRELKKNQLSTLDTGGIRREMVSELQKQKNELQAIKRIEVDQIAKKFEIEISRLTNENQRLQTEMLNKSLAQQGLQAEVKKLQTVSKTAEKISKEKLIDYQKKMATLNSEIYLTQNLYDNFIQAKSRVKKQI